MASQPCESSTERMPMIISRLLCSLETALSWLMLLSSPTSLCALSGFWASWMRWEQVCGFVESTSWPMTLRREELRQREDGIEKREGGILCNGVENTKDRQTHAFVIFVSLRPLPHPHLLPFCLLFPVSLFSWSFKSSLFCFTFRVKWCQEMPYRIYMLLFCCQISLFFSQFWNSSDGYKSFSGLLSIKKFFVPHKILY